MPVSEGSLKRVCFSACFRRPSPNLGSGAWGLNFPQEQAAPHSVCGEGDPGATVGLDSNFAVT